MAQHVGDFFERATLIKQSTCQGMSQCMRSAMLQTDTLIGIADDTANSVNANRLIPRRLASNKNSLVKRFWTFLLEVTCQCFTGDLGQRQYVLASGL